MKKILSASFLILSVYACNQQDLSQEVDQYLLEYNKTYQNLSTTASEASWKLNTKIIEGDSGTAKEVQTTSEAYAAFVGSTENIEKAKKYLDKKEKLSPLQIKQLETILYMASGGPETAKDIIQEVIKAGTKQTKDLFGFNFVIDDKSVSTNDIEEILNSSNDVTERLKAWEASKEVGRVLKDGLENLQHLRNKSVQIMGYHDYFEYQVADYGVTSEELRKICKDMINETWPLYRELHTWARYTLAKKYKQPVPDMLPAHWLPNRWGQDWTGIIEVEGVNINSALKQKSAEWIVESGEKFYTSIGFDKLPGSFYEKSSLYPAPENATYKKNNHASAWHIDLDKDVRSLMSVVPNAEWWETTLHELGHIYYYMTYSNPDVPIILRGGANRAFHEAIGTMIGLASLQQPFLEEFELIASNVKIDTIQLMLKEALNYVVLTPWAAGVMTEFEYDLYANNLPKDQYNKKWWEMVTKYQGIVPPTQRGEEYCDAASKTHINDDPAQYYDYAMSNILLFQFHIYIAKNILHQDPHFTNYYGNKAVGEFLKKMMYYGSVRNWKELLKENIGQDMSARPMVQYFNPLMDYLQKVNQGRTYTLPENL